MDLKLHHPCGNQILKIIALQVAGWSLLLVQACSHLLNHGLAGLYAHTSLTLQVLDAADDSLLDDQLAFGRLASCSLRGLSR